MSRKVIPGIVVPHFLILLIDVVIFLASIWLAYLLRFNFNIPASELRPLPFIILLMVSTRIIIAALTRTYRGIIKYNTVFDMLRVYLYCIMGSIVFLLASLVSYYLVNRTLFIPLTIIVIEFLITSFLLLLSRSLIRATYSSSVDKKVLRRIKEKLKGEP